MTIEEKVIANLKYAIRWNDKPTQKSMEVAIASLEAWDKVKEQIKNEAEFAYADFDEYKYEVLGIDDVDDLPNDDFRYGMERTLEIINKYLKEVIE